MIDWSAHHGPSQAFLTRARRNGPLSVQLQQLTVAVLWGQPHTTQQSWSGLMIQDGKAQFLHPRHLCGSTMFLSLRSLTSSPMLGNLISSTSLRLAPRVCTGPLRQNRVRLFVITDLTSFATPCPVPSEAKLSAPRVSTLPPSNPMPSAEASRSASSR